MKVNPRIVERLEKLVAQGEAVLRTEHTGGGGGQIIDSQLAAEWITSAKSLIGSVFDRDSDHYIELSNATKGHVGPSACKLAHGIVRAALADYRDGAIFKVRRLIEAEVFTDFLEQAEHLFEAGYHAPAAVVAGCVLEDALRRLCDRNQIPLSDKPKLDTMNADLVKKGVYTLLTQKQVTAHADIRNRAAHGKWDEFTKQDVKEMIRFTGRFLEEHCG